MICFGWYLCSLVIFFKCTGHVAAASLLVGGASLVIFTVFSPNLFLNLSDHPVLTVKLF
jgi:hypothetical protein